MILRQPISKLLALCLVLAMPMSGMAVDHDTFFTDTLQPTFKESCTECHGRNGEVEGDVNLLNLKNVGDLTGDLELLENLVDVLGAEEMPPEDEPQLDAKHRQQLLAQLQKLLHEVVSKQKSAAQAPIRRMNRFQYSNAVRDLFDLKVAIFPLPERVVRDYGYFKPETGKMPDVIRAGNRPLGKSQMNEKRLADVLAFPQDLRAEHGFDNQGDHLSLSPLLMESFIELSRSVIDSPTFTDRTCGIWQQFFAPPAPSGDTRLAVQTRLESFLTRAFRRPPGTETLQRFTNHVMGLIAAGSSFTNSMKSAAAAAIASPRFLYLYDRASSADKAETVDDYELASRLSFFLWGSIPDQPLLDLAAAGKLKDPTVLAGQVDRMMTDRKLKRFCDSFPSQWLQMDRIISVKPDPKQHPDFYFSGGQYNASMHMMLEPLLVFETILIEDRSILELIDAPFSYRSEALVSWYADGKLNKARPAVNTYTRVAITDRRQGGVMTNAAVMTMTSGPKRTHPITRGAWLATVIFNDPPPPPPADVPPLPEDKKDTSHLTIRERLAAHRERADCAGCHEQIDPLGFALENYGPTGLWRTVYDNNREIDMSGKLFRQHKFASVVEFKDAILQNKNRFTRALVGHLLAFALAREIDATDAVALDRIVEQATVDDYRLKGLIKQVVLSESFQRKYNPPEDDR
ncbi:hypothetical protein Poly51_34530 [Rubripirellula tenax]|uniref:Cytochrome c domain-containing protein n=2 Tax=Rubripirellula tenax TaxID=2528015 RepID=A0A5C6F295_9BACT|nr:hypothetical protein Poly51_34530 [Rubripirellula tenax]